MRNKAKRRSSSDQHIEITANMRSFAFLRLQAAVSHVHDLMGSVQLYNEFPHTLENSIFFEFAYQKYTEKKYVSPFEESATDYVMRLDLGRNQDFLDEMAFLYLVNAFNVYLADILAVAALGSPEKFDLRVRLDASKMACLGSHTKIMREVAISIVSQITFMSYSELRKLLLSKIKLTKGAQQQLMLIDRCNDKRNILTHGLGISRLAVDMHRNGEWPKREKITKTQLNSAWNAIVKLSKTVDKRVMKNFDVWRGVDICAPGLYRRAGDRLIREDEQGAYD